MTAPPLSEQDWDDLHSIAALAIKESGRVMSHNGEIAYAFWAGQQSQSEAIAALRADLAAAVRERDEARADAQLHRNAAASIGARQAQVLIERDNEFDRAERAEADLAAARADGERLDKLELCIRDGSYASIFADIVAVCRHAYTTVGPGPALRTAIDSAIAASRKGSEG